MHLYKDKWHAGYTGKRHHIHFNSCSNNVSAQDPCGRPSQARGRYSVCMYDMFKGAGVPVLAPVMNIFCDNPLASELINHLGNSATEFCRVCLVKIWLISTYFVEL